MKCTAFQGYLFIGSNDLEIAEECFPFTMVYLSQ